MHRRTLSPDNTAPSNDIPPQIFAAEYFFSPRVVYLITTACNEAELPQEMMPGVKTVKIIVKALQANNNVTLTLTVGFWLRPCGKFA